MATSDPSRLDQIFDQEKVNNLTLRPKVQMVNAYLTPTDKVLITRLTRGQELVSGFTITFVIKGEIYLVVVDPKFRLSSLEIEDKIKKGQWEDKSFGDPITKLYQQKKDGRYYSSEGYPLTPISAVITVEGKPYVIDPSSTSTLLSKENSEVYADGDIYDFDNRILYKKDGAFYRRSDNPNTLYNAQGQPLIPISEELVSSIKTHWKTQPIKRDTYGSARTLDSINPVGSNRAFYIRISDPEAKGKGTYKAVLMVKGPETSDGVLEEDEIELFEEKNPSNPGVFRSPPLVLVPSPEMDRAEINRPLGKPYREQTFFAKPGSSLSVVLENEQGKKIAYPLGSVPIKGIVETQLIVYGKENYEQSLKNYEKQINILREVWAPLGIQIKSNPPIVREKQPNNSLPATTLDAANIYPSNKGIRFIAGPTMSYRNLPGIEKTPWFKIQKESLFLSSDKPMTSQDFYSRTRQFAHILIESAPGDDIANYREANENSISNLIPYEHRSPNNLLSKASNLEDADELYPYALTPAQEKVMLQSPLIQPPTPRSSLQSSLTP